MKSRKMETREMEKFGEGIKWPLNMAEKNSVTPIDLNCGFMEIWRIDSVVKLWQRKKHTLKYQCAVKSDKFYGTWKVLLNSERLRW